MKNIGVYFIRFDSIQTSERKSTFYFLQMKFFTSSIVIFIVFNSIELSIQNNIPVCIQKKINNILAEPVWNPPATVMKYSYRDQTIFLFSSNCCDQFNSLYDESCHVICAPSGGFTGRGDGRCTDFYQTGKLLSKVWIDQR